MEGVIKLDRRILLGAKIGDKVGRYVVGTDREGKLCLVNKYRLVRTF